MHANLSILHHSWMLSDKTRLNSFKKAIDQTVRDKSVVVDIGTGTGILSAYAAANTQNPVYAVEYFDDSAALATKLFEQSSFKNVKVIQNSSYETMLPQEPDILITETIGQIGPEENIVEICFDFCRRYPTIKHVIPQNVSVFAQFIKSQKARSFVQNIFDGYLNANFVDFKYQHILQDLKKELSTIILQCDLSDAVPIHGPILLAQYDLGTTESPQFKKEFIMDNYPSDIFLHLYFEAQLADAVSLSSNFKQDNHWKHSFVYIDNGKEKVVIEFVPGTNFIAIT